MPRSVVDVPGEQRFVNYDVPWEKYEQMAAWYEGRHVRLTYDRGSMKLSTTSARHQQLKKLLARLIDVLTEELSLPVQSGGNMTFQYKDLERGVEPDECYWFANETVMRDVATFDSARHPPPDIALEVEVSRSVLDRLDIFAAMKVREVWRWDGETLTICHLSRRKYIEATASRFLPLIALAELTRFCAMKSALGETEVVRAFRAWVREQIAAGWTAAPARPRRS